MYDKIEKHKKFKEIKSNLEKWINEDSRYTNHDHGVDLNYTICAKDLGLEEGDEFNEAMEKLGDDYGFYYTSPKNGEDGFVTTSSDGDIFLSYPEEDILFPPSEKNNYGDVKPTNEFHAYCLIERWMAEADMCPSVWKLGHYDYPEIHKWSEDYKGNIEKSEEDLDSFLAMFKFAEEVKNGESEMSLENCPKEILNRFPCELKRELINRDTHVEEVEVDLDGVTLGLYIHRSELDKKGGYFSIKELEKDAVQVGKADKYGDIFFKYQVFYKNNTLTYMEYLKEKCEGDTIGLTGVAS